MLIRACLLAIGLLAATTPAAWAACATRDLAGSWDLWFAADSIVGSGAAVCTVRIGRTGRLVARNSQCLDAITGQIFNAHGVLSVNRLCRVTGAIGYADLAATMSTTKNFFGGIGRSFGLVLSFQAIKR